MPLSNIKPRNSGCQKVVSIKIATDHTHMVNATVTFTSVNRQAGRELVGRATGGMCSLIRLVSLSCLPPCSSPGSMSVTSASNISCSCLQMRLESPLNCVALSAKSSSIFSKEMRETDP